MGRPALIADDDLLARIGRVFRDVGYEGASLSILSEATGLKRPSLYHRFPHGKEQMATEVLGAAERWLDVNVLAALRSDAPPADRIAAMVARLGEFYEEGERACLLNMLSAPLGTTGAFADRVRRTFEAWIDALVGVVEATGCPREEAWLRATRAVSLVQGSLVVSRGLGSTAPFETAVASLEAELLGEDR